MLYLSEIKRAKVVDPAGAEIGRLADLAVVPREQFPAVQWAIVRASDGERIVRWADLEASNGGYRLKDGAVPPAAGGVASACGVRVPGGIGRGGNGEPTTGVPIVRSSPSAWWRA